MSNIQRITTVGETVILTNGAMRPFHEIGYALMGNGDYAEPLKTKLGSKLTALLVRAYGSVSGYGEQTPTAIRVEGTDVAIFSGDEAQALLELLEIARTDPQTVNRAVLNRDSAERLLG